jgi:two-component system chemotaxis response regulator CheB
LWEIDDPSGVQYKCRTGHAFSPESLMEVNAAALDDAVWAGYRSLLEQADLARRMSRRMRDSGNERSRRRYETMATDAERRAQTLHTALVLAEPEQDTAEHA